MYKQELNSGALKDIIAMNTVVVKKLLEDKGFPNTPDKMAEKIALLHTEVAELTDAFKKGKGKDEEGEEIADIIIRMLNFTSMFPQLIVHLNNPKIKETIGIHYEEENEFDCKYKNACNLHAYVNLVGEQIGQYVDLLKVDPATLEEEKKKELQQVIEIAGQDAIAMMIAITAFCEFYNQQFLGLNLQDLIDKKLDKNFNRPYRYNTSEEHFQ